MPGIRVKGLDRLERRLGGVAALRRTYLEPTMRAGVHYVHAQVPPYPPQTHKPYPFVSERQRRYVKAAIARGEITVPYRRTGQLGRSITTRVDEIGGSVVGIIGTNVEYAPWVISSEPTPDGIGPQAKYHQGNWWTLQEVVEGAFPGVVRLFERRLTDLLGA